MQGKIGLSSLLVYGDINVDVLARVEAWAGLGGDNLAPEMEQHLGGVGANMAVALARWGVTARLLACVGHDAFGEFALGVLKNEGVDVSFVQQTAQAMTGLIFIPITPDGQRTIIGSRGANAQFSQADRNWNCLDGVAGLHLMGYNFLSAPGADASRRLIAEARARGAWVSLDAGMAPSQQIPDTILEAARNVDITFLGLQEAAALMRKKEKAGILKALEHCGLGQVVMKLGAQGCVIREDKEWREVPPLRVQAVDTTGCGDAFAAAFLRARLQGWPHAESALLANAAGAAAATVMGAGEGMPGGKQIVHMLENSKLSDSWEQTRLNALQLLRQERKRAESPGASGGKHAIGA